LSVIIREDRMSQARSGHPRAPTSSLVLNHVRSDRPSNIDADHQQPDRRKRVSWEYFWKHWTLPSITPVFHVRSHLSWRADSIFGRR